jgi:hypothetical protein
MASSMAGVVNGQLAVQGLTVAGEANKIIFDGTATPSADAAAATALAFALPRRQSTFNGSLVLSVTGQELLWPAAQVEVRRALVWSYSSSLEAFTASVALYGQLTVAVMTNATGVWGLQAGSAQVVCTVGGEVVLSSKAYPGPGFTGDYTWAGTLSITPDPWARLGVQSGVGSATPPAAAVEAGHRRHVLHSAAGADGLGAGGAGREVLQAGGGSGAGGVLQPVYGPLSVTEVGAVAPTIQETVGLLYLDAAGEVVMTGRVPEVLVPKWANPIKVTMFIPLWMYLALAAAILFMVCSAVFCWVLVLRKRKAQEQQQVYPRVGRPAAAGVPPRSTGSKPHHTRGSSSSGWSAADRPRTNSRRHARRVSDLPVEGRGSPSPAPSRGMTPRAWDGSSRRSSQGWWDAEGATASPPITPHSRHAHQHHPGSRQQHRARSPSHHQPPSRGHAEAPPYTGSSSSGRPARQHAWGGMP